MEAYMPLKWRHNERDGISNHQPCDCLLNRLYKAQIKENIKAPRHWPLWPVTGVFPHKGPVTQKMFPFDDVIMVTRPWWLKSRKVIPIHIHIHIYIIVLKSADCVCWGRAALCILTNYGDVGRMVTLIIPLYQGERLWTVWKRYGDIYFVLNSYTKGLAWIRTWHLKLYSRFILGLLTFIWWGFHWYWFYNYIIPTWL